MFNKMNWKMMIMKNTFRMEAKCMELIQKRCAIFVQEVTLNNYSHKINTKKAEDQLDLKAGSVMTFEQRYTTNQHIYSKYASNK